MRIRAVLQLRFALALSFALAASAVGQTVPVYIFAGQSNMVGYATDYSELTLAQQAPQPNVLYAGQHQNPIAWAPINGPTQVNTPNPPNPFDPGLYQVYSGQGIGAEFSAPLTISNGNFGQKVGAVKYALNIFGLRQDGGQSDWAPASGELYSSMVSRVNTAVSQLSVQQPGMNGQVAGFFWMQGERDSQDEDRADLYQYNLTNFISSVRAQFGANLPFVIGRIINDSGGGTYPGFDTIRRAQENVARLIPNVAIISTDDLSRGSAGIPVGPVHYSTQGTYEMGVRMGKAYLDLQNPLPTAPASMNLALNGNFEDYAIGGRAGFPGTHPATGQPFPANAMPGWNAGTGAGHTLVRTGAFGAVAASSGQQFLSLENGQFNPGSLGGASQTFSTNSTSNSILRFYTVFFDYSAISRGDNGTSQFTYNLSSGTTSVGTTTLTVNTAGVPQNNMVPWQSTSFTFNSGGSQSTLRFQARDPLDNLFYGAAIDNVKIINGPVWTGTGGNTSWNNNSNWNNGNDPNDAGGEGQKANFLWTAASTSINMNVGVSLHSLRFDSPNSYSINNAANRLDMRSNNVGNTSILVARGDHSVNVPINLNNVPMDVDVADSSTLTLSRRVSSAIAGLTITKFGAGSLILGDANNTYSGATRVVAGTLRLANNTTANNISASPSITVYRGATLDTSGLSGGGITLAANQDLVGSGTLRGGVNATASGVNISPGNSPGIMTFAGAGNITLGSNTVLDVEVGGLGDSTGDAGVNFDRFVIDGAGKTLVTGGARLNLIVLAGPAHMQPYTIVSAINGATINSAALLTNLAGVLTEGVTYTQSGRSYTVDYEPTSISLTFVPEPSSIGLVLLGVWGMLARRRGKSGAVSAWRN